MGISFSKAAVNDSKVYCDYSPTQEPSLLMESVTVVHSYTGIDSEPVSGMEPTLRVDIPIAETRTEAVPSIQVSALESHGAHALPPSLQTPRTVLRNLRNSSFENSPDTSLPPTPLNQSTTNTPRGAPIAPGAFASGRQNPSLLKEAVIGSRKSPSASMLISPRVRFSEQRQSIKKCQTPVYFMLDSQSFDIGRVISFQDKEMEINPFSFTGPYDYCLVEQSIAQKEHAEGHTFESIQYLIINPLLTRDPEFANSFIKELPGYADDKMAIIAKGEISFCNSKIIDWTLNSEIFIEENSAFIPEVKNKLDGIKLPKDKYTRRFRDAAWLALPAPELKTVILCRNKDKRINPLSLTGKYAFCLIEQTRIQQEPIQYLIINPLDKWESNHRGFGNIWIRKLPDFNKDTTKILAGGEITFGESEIIEWNLQSGGFSAGTVFDEKNGAFNENKARIMLPQHKWTEVDFAKEAAQHFSGNGAGSFIKDNSMNALAMQVFMKFGKNDKAKSLNDLNPISDSRKSLTFFNEESNKESAKKQLSSPYSSDKLDCRIPSEDRDEFLAKSGKFIENYPGDEAALKNKM